MATTVDGSFMRRALLAVLGCVAAGLVSFGVLAGATGAGSGHALSRGATPVPPTTAHPMSVAHPASSRRGMAAASVTPAAHPASSTVPAAARGPISATLGNEETGYRLHGLAAENPQQGFSSASHSPA